MLQSWTKPMEPFEPSLQLKRERQWELLSWTQGGTNLDLKKYIHSTYKTEILLVKNYIFFFWFIILVRFAVIFHLRVSGCSSRCRVCSSCPFSTETRLYLPSWFSWRQKNKKSQQCKSHDFEHFTEWTDIKVTEITLHSTSLKKHYSYKWPCLKIDFLLKKWEQSHELFTGNRIY